MASPKPVIDSAVESASGAAADDFGSWPYYAPDEIEAVVEVLRSGKVNQWTGDRVWQFAADLERHHQVRHAIPVANGTLAIDLALRALGIGPGDEVIVTPRSFVASATTVDLVGATPVFADIDRDSQCLNVASVAEKITPRTRAVIAVHLAGWPVDMPALMELAGNRGLKVIEDCAQAHGARIDGRPVGSFGDAAALSFCQDKIVSTGGEGGATLFQDEDAWRRAWSFKDHGKSMLAIESKGHAHGFRWLIEGIGTNYRLTEMQAAIGLRQYAKLDRWNRLRTRNARIWADALMPLSAIRVPWPPASITHAWYRFYAFVRPERLKPRVDRDTILAELKHQRLPGMVGACPEIYREKVYARRNLPTLDIAAELGRTSLMFDTHHRLEPTMISATAAKVADVIRRLSD